MWAEIARRLQGQATHRGDFAGVHVCPESDADIPDTDETRLVILHPRVAHHKKATSSSAVEFARHATQQQGTANRVNRNMLVFLAADEHRLVELDVAVRDYLGWTHVLDNEIDLVLTQNQKNQAMQRRQQADQTVTARLLQTFVWALVPQQPDPAAPFVISSKKVDGQSTSLAERVSRRLRDDGELLTRHAAATIRLAINTVPQLWQDGHVSLGELWKLYCTYPYMPRLRDRRVLNEGVGDMPVRWQTDAFALATAYDEASGRYVGLWTNDDEGASPPPATDSLLLVQPDVAGAQRQTEGAEPAPMSAISDGSRPATHHSSDPAQPGILGCKTKTRFFGSKTLDADRYAMDFKIIADAIVAHLRDPSVDLAIRVEIETTSSSGFDEGTIRTVSENAGTLKFDQSGFEEN